MQRTKARLCYIGYEAISLKDPAVKDDFAVISRRLTTPVPPMREPFMFFYFLEHYGQPGGRHQPRRVIFGNTCQGGNLHWLSSGLYLLQFFYCLFN